MLQLIRNIQARRDRNATLSCGHRIDLESHGAQATVIDCRACDERHLPDGTVVGRATPTFDADSMPAGLRRSHRTSAWAVLTVRVGSVRFVEADRSFEAMATPSDPIVIVPDRPHHVEPSPDARFFIQFHSLDMSSTSERDDSLG